MDQDNGRCLCYKALTTLNEPFYPISTPFVFFFAGATLNFCSIPPSSLRDPNTFALSFAILPHITFEHTTTIHYSRSAMDHFASFDLQSLLSSEDIFNPSSSSSSSFSIPVSSRSLEESEMLVNYEVHGSYDGTWFCIIAWIMFCLLNYDIFMTTHVFFCFDSLFHLSHTFPPLSLPNTTHATQSLPNSLRFPTFRFRLEQGSFLFHHALYQLSYFLLTFCFVVFDSYLYPILIPVYHIRYPVSVSITAWFLCFVVFDHHLYPILVPMYRTFLYQ